MISLLMEREEYEPIILAGSLSSFMGYIEEHPLNDVQLFKATFFAALHGKKSILEYLISLKGDINMRDCNVF